MVALAITPFIVRILGSSLYGDYAFIVSLISVSMILTNAGIDEGVRKYVAEERATPNWKEKVFGYYTRLGVVLAISGASVIILANVSGITARFIGSDLEPYLYLASALIIVKQSRTIVRSSLMGIGSEHVSESLLVGEQILFGILAVSLAFIGYNVVGILTGQILAHFAFTILGLYFLSKAYDITFIFKPTPADFPNQELAKFNVLSIILMLLTASLYHTDILLLQPLAGSSATGYYKAALAVAEFLWLVPIVLQTFLLHSTSEIWSKQNSESITRISARITRYTLTFTLLMAIGLAALADSFVPLYYGNEFGPAVLPLVLLLPGALGFALSRPIFAIGHGKGDLTLLIVATGSASLINLVLNLLLIPRHGTAGAAVATSIGYGSMLIFHVIVARRLGYDPFADLRLDRILITAAVATPVIFVADELIKSGLLSLVLVPPVGLLFYTTVVLKTRAIHPEELISILERVPQPYSEWGIKLIWVLG